MYVNLQTVLFIPYKKFQLFRKLRHFPPGPPLFWKFCVLRRSSLDHELKIHWDCSYWFHIIERGFHDILICPEKQNVDSRAQMALPIVHHNVVYTWWSCAWVLPSTVSLCSRRREDVVCSHHGSPLVARRCWIVGVTRSLLLIPLCLCFCLFRMGLALLGKALGTMQGCIPLRLPIVVHAIW